MDDLDLYQLGVQHGETLGFIAGYAEGDRDGYERGVQQRHFDLLVADPEYHVDRDLAPSESRAELERRRREYQGIDREPVRARTPEQIRARAEWSWRRAERRAAG